MGGGRIFAFGRLHPGALLTPDRRIPKSWCADLTFFGLTPSGSDHQQLVRGEPFRGKYRQSFEKPVPFVPGQPERITFELPDVAHTFRRGHRIMVQVQSSWFPLTDRNPQKFMDIPKARATDFQKATQRVFIGGDDGSRLELRVLE